MATGPTSLTIRTYHVGFGDCFLLSFRYSGSSEKHVLIDFGSTGMPASIDEKPDARMMRIARDIEARCKGSLTAVVATHRHRDHISGFTTKAGGKGTGDIIRGLKPKLVLQPWTEDPDLAKDAPGPADGADKKKTNGSHIAGLSLMNETAAEIAALADRKGSASQLGAARAELGFIGEDNILNASAVKNLMTMAKNNYLFYGANSGLEKLLPGVDVTVLGPPTIRQSADVKKERSSDPNEFWQLQANALAGAGARQETGGALFPDYVVSSGPSFDVHARWFIYHARNVHADQLLQIVRILDQAMNNTSIILLFQIGKKSLLFPGDAQIENWSYALSSAANKKLLAETDLYKVGHHGSRNATPRTLWGLFKNRSPKQSATRLLSLMSTMEGKHGTESKHTEVPRGSLVTALKKETDFFTTESLSKSVFFHDTVVKF